MRSRILSVVLVCFVAVWLPAQEEETFVPPWRAPVPDVEEGATLIAVGFWGDAIGFGLMAGSSAAYSISFGAGQTLFELGLVSMLLVGNPCLNRGLTDHHDALVARGFDVETANRDKSRLFSKIALGCGGGAVALGIGAAVTDSLGLAITSLVAGATGAVFEIINFYKFRPAWYTDMKVAAGLVEP
jgi:hypothetical protein